jgi:hypothetical protein
MTALRCRDRLRSASSICQIVLFDTSDRAAAPLRRSASAAEDHVGRPMEGQTHGRTTPP